MIPPLAANASLLAWTPFINPMNVFHEWWYLLMIPLAFGISVTYKAVRMPNLQRFWREAWAMTAQIVLAMIGLALVVMLLVQVVIPWLPAEQRHWRDDPIIRALIARKTI